jgi:hypothetical protein
MKDVSRHLGQCTIAEFDDDKQKRYIATLGRIGDEEDWLHSHDAPAQSGPTITRRLSVLIAALNLAVKDNVIASAPHPST